jgi:hypothetical protein
MPTKPCLNCGTYLTGNFCSYCGQKDLPAKETFRSLFGQFLGGILNYDSALVKTMTRLFGAPGKLSADYLKGQRARYIHPVRLYLFISALFFLSLNYVFVPLEKSVESSSPWDQKEQKKSAQKEAPVTIKWGEDQNKVDSYVAFLAQQDSLPAAKKASALEHMVVKQYFKVNSAYPEDADIAEVLLKQAVEMIPQLLFVLLPLLALVNRIVFFRRKKFWFMDHAVFVLHMATSLFITLWVIWWVDYGALIHAWLGWSWISNSLTICWLVFYLISFIRFYELSWKRSLALWVWTGLLHSILLALGFGTVGVLSFLWI